MKDLKPYQMELDLIIQQSTNYGKIIPEVYALNYFIFNQQKQKQLPPSIKKQIKIKNEKLNIILTPQILPDEEKIKYRYLNAIDFDVLNYIIWKASHQINKLPTVIVSLNEISNLMKYNKQKIKESLSLLSYRYGLKERTKVWPMTHQSIDTNSTVRQKQARPPIKP
jgi:hypothetical protein